MSSQQKGYSMSGFDEYKLGDLLTFQRGFDITKSEQQEGDVPIVSSSGISSFHNQSKASAPGVVIGRKGSLGTVHYLKANYWPHDTTLWIKDFKGNEPGFIYYFLQTLHLENFDVGSSNPTLNRNHLHKIRVLFPKEQQKKIAAALSVYDDLIENNCRRIELLEQMAEELYREWFVRFRFPGYQQAAFNKGIPVGWRIGKLSELVRINPSEKIDKSETKPFVAMDDLSTGSMLFSFKEMRAGSAGSKFRNRDVLLPRITPSLENGKRGFVMVLDDDQVGIGSTEFIVLREQVLTAEYIYFLSISRSLREHAELSMTGASGRQRVQENCLDFFLVPEPPPSIMAKFSEIVAPHFKELHLLAQKERSLAATRDALLARLISGKLPVDQLDIQFPPSMREAEAARLDVAHA